MAVSLTAAELSLLQLVSHTNRKRLAGTSHAINDGVEGGTWAHHSVGLLLVQHVVATDVTRNALAVNQFLLNLGLIRGEALRNGSKLRLQLSVIALRQSLGPVQRQVVVGATIVNLLHLTRWVLVSIEELLVGLVQARGQGCKLRISELLRVVFQADGIGKELSEGIPPEVRLLEELLDVLRRRTTSARLIHASVGQEWHNREHLRTRAKLQDREKIGVVVSQHVASDRNSAETLLGSLERDAASVCRPEDLEVEARDVVLTKIGVHLAQDLAVVRAVHVQPEHCRPAASPGTRHCQLYPVLDGDILGLASAPDITSLNVVLQQGVVAAVAHDTHDTVRRGLEGLVMGTVLLGLLGHEANVWHRAHGRWIEGTILLAEFHGNCEDVGVAPVWDHRLGVDKVGITGSWLRVWAPHASAQAVHSSDHGWHGRVNDNVARHMQIGDALVGVHHGNGWAIGIGLLDVSLDFLPLLLWQLLDLAEDIAEAIVRIRANLGERASVLVEDILEEHLHAVAEHDWIGHLHHGGLQVQGEEHSLRLGIRDFLREEITQESHVHAGGIQDLTSLQGHLLLENRGLAILSDVLDPHGVRSLHGDGLLGAEEVALLHVRHVRLRVLLPGTHLMRVLLRIVLHWNSRTTVGVAFAKHRIHGTSEHLVVLLANSLLLCGLRILWKFWHVVALALQLGNALLQLRNGCADVRQLDELKSKGYNVPEFPEDPKTAEEKTIREKYNKVLGSAVNPVLREGNSDRRAAVPVKNYAKKYPHKMGPWKQDSKAHVSHMQEGDFFGSEQSVTMEAADSVRIEHVAKDG